MLALMSVVLATCMQFYLDKWKICDDIDYGVVAILFAVLSGSSIAVWWST